MDTKKILFIYGLIIVLFDLCLLIYAFYYYKKVYKKNKKLDNIEELVDKINLIKINNDAIIKKQLNEANYEKKEFVKVPFKVLFDDLNEEQKQYYDNIIDFANTHENITIAESEFDKKIRYGKRKILCNIYVRNSLVVVKVNMGTIKVKGAKPLKLKPIKITLKDEESFNEFKETFESAYEKLSGKENYKEEQ